MTFENMRTCQDQLEELDRISVQLEASRASRESRHAGYLEQLNRKKQRIAELSSLLDIDDRGGDYLGDNVSTYGDDHDPDDADPFETFNRPAESAAQTAHGAGTDGAGAGVAAGTAAASSSSAVGGATAAWAEAAAAIARGVPADGLEDDAEDEEDMMDML